MATINSTREEQTTAKSAAGTSPRAYASVLALGILLGIVFVKSEVACWQRVQNMFRFEEAHMYLIIGVAIGVAMMGMQLIKRSAAKSIDGQPIRYKPKPYHKGVIFGGFLFGAGWAITGACPGPIYAQMGGGEWMAACTFVGAMLGMYAYAALKPILPH